MKGKRVAPMVSLKMTRYLKRSSPTILACIGAVGVVATAVLAVKATPKAMLLIRDDSRKKHDGDPHAATKTEIVKACWMMYIPAVATGTATIACIFGANALNRRQQASLASAYALLSHSYHDYKSKVVERYGAEAHKEILTSIAVEKCGDVSLTAESMWSSTSLEFEDSGEEERLFYDNFSRRYFQTTISRVLQAEYHLNRNFALAGGEISLNSFYSFLGLQDVQGGDDIGWMVTDEMYWVDFNHYKAVMEDGLECYVIEMMSEPGPPIE